VLYTDGDMKTTNETKDIKVNDRIQDRAPGHHGGVVVEIIGDLAVVQWDNSFNDKIVLGRVWLGLIEKVARVIK
jgi:hypothetical protein